MIFGQEIKTPENVHLEFVKESPNVDKNGLKSSEQIGTLQ